MTLKQSGKIALLQEISFDSNAWFSPGADYQEVNLTGSSWGQEHAKTI